MWAAVALAFGLAMDATAVSAARGLGRREPREVILLPALFGGFQAGMSALGWLAGVWVGPYLVPWDTYVAFGLLFLIGGKMVRDALRPAAATEAASEPDARPPLSLYLGLAIATSIDAAAAGLTLPLVPAPPWLSLVLIGTVTAACSAIGYLAGQLVGKYLGARLGLVGGLVLIAIGVNILVSG
ncbi:MAG TPA: manganese efflux pump MntP family protein [Kofleriaceae bacterium]|nr:manganese efflux pump MntP family protein [Kofleriaceae bacterium]